MIACSEAGCDGTVAADGYCDTCGTKAPTQGTPPPNQPSPSAVPQAPAAAIGGSCTQHGCDGTVAADGYCDTCGLAAVATGAGTGISSARASTDAAAELALAETMGSIALPVPPSTARRLPGAGTATARSRETTTGRTARSARSGIGAGLVEVEPTDVGDPASAVMSEANVQGVLGAVPEDKRVCSSCGSPVGRADGAAEGRVNGFCGQCRTPFDFITNRPVLTAGELVAGQYEIAGPLAHGGMGWIYLGRDRAVSDRWVVLKGLLNADDPDAAAAAVAERRFLAEIDHANIVNIYNFVTHRSAGYIVMEMVGGESLNAKLKDRREANGGVPDPLPVEDAIAYILGVLPAFGYLHDRSLVYNDLKPANIMAVGNDVKLIDVGAVMRTDDQSAAIFGTQGFQAPEVASDGPSIASDLFTVGRTLAVLVIGFVFHKGPYLYALPSPADEPLFVRWESLYRFLLRATATHPDDRFQSAQEMAEQLTGVLREIVSLREGRPHPSASTVFEGDRLPELLVQTGDNLDPAVATWRVLPTARVDADHPDAAFLLTLPEADPGRSAAALRSALDQGTVEPNNEVLTHLVWEMLNVEAPDHEQIQRLLAQAENADPWDWRIAWYRGIQNLQLGRADQAAEAFNRVWTDLPGETAPKLAVALAAELAQETGRSQHLYDLVTRSDNSYVSAAFGLARCNHRLNRTDAVIEALQRVPATSAAHYDAQVTSARILVEGGPTGAPSEEELAAASATVERLQLAAAERAEISADIFERALAGLEDGRISPSDRLLLEHRLDEQSIRKGLAEAYRLQARLANDPREREQLIDQANSVRPWSLF